MVYVSLSQTTSSIIEKHAITKQKNNINVFSLHRMIQNCTAILQVLTWAISKNVPINIYLKMLHFWVMASEIIHCDFCFKGKMKPYWNFWNLSQGINLRVFYGFHMKNLINWTYVNHFWLLIRISLYICVWRWYNHSKMCYKATRSHKRELK